jgi:hypothetical protein
MRQVDDASDERIKCELPIIFLCLIRHNNVLKLPDMLLNELSLLIADSDNHQTQSTRQVNVKRRKSYF